jgi:hypothetical protein
MTGVRERHLGRLRRVEGSSQRHLGDGAPANAGTWGLVRDCALSFSIVLRIGFLLLVSSVLGLALAGFGIPFIGTVPAFAWMLQGANPLVSATIFSMLIAIVSKLLPTPGWPGATYQGDTEVTQVHANRLGSWIVSQAEAVGRAA